jgi:hypothetical protein
MVNSFEEDGTLPKFILDIKGPQSHPPNLTELQELWDSNTKDFKSTCFQTLITYKTHKTSILKNIIDSDGEITKSLLSSVKNQEALLLNSDCPKSKHAGIKKEALSCCLFWAKHRKEWIATGHQQALEAIQIQDEKAKDFQNKKESKAYNIALPVSSNSFKHHHTPNTPPEYSTPQKSPFLPPSQTCQIPPLPSSTTKPRTNEQWDISLSKQRKRQRKDHGWFEQRKHSEKLHEQQRNVNRRLVKYKSASFRNKQTNNLLLEYHDNILSLCTLGVIQPEIHNISSKEIEPELTEALLMGHKFIPTTKIKHDII